MNYISTVSHISSPAVIPTTLVPVLERVLNKDQSKAPWDLAHKHANQSSNRTTWQIERGLCKGFWGQKGRKMWNINIIISDHQAELFCVISSLLFRTFCFFCLGSASCIKKDQSGKKEGKLYFTNKLKYSLVCSSTTDCGTFWWSKASFEAGRYVLIIWLLNDDTQFIINGPHPSTLPSSISALAIFCTIWSFCNYTSFCSSYRKLFVK